MKKILNIFVVMLVAMMSTSCLDSNLEELDVYSGCDVTNANVYCRYYGTDKIPASGEQKVLQVLLDIAERKQDAENCTYNIKYKTNKIPASELADFRSKAVVVLTISTAAVVKPIDGAPTLGAPGDWTKDNKYEVTAADGSKKVWTIRVEPNE